MTDLRTLPWRDRRARIVQVANAILAAATEPLETSVIAAAVSKALGVTDIEFIARELSKAAPYHAHALQDGRHVLLYGKPRQLWRWHPQPQRDGPVWSATVGPLPMKPAEPSPEGYSDCPHCHGTGLALTRSLWTSEPEDV